MARSSRCFLQFFRSFVGSFIRFCHLVYHPVTRSPSLHAQNLSLPRILSVTDCLLISTGVTSSFLKMKPQFHKFSKLLFQFLRLRFRFFVRAGKDDDQQVACSTPGRSAFEQHPWTSRSHTSAFVTEQYNMAQA